MLVIQEYSDPNLNKVQEKCWLCMKYFYGGRLKLVLPSAHPHKKKERTRKFSCNMQHDSAACTENFLMSKKNRRRARSIHTLDSPRPHSWLRLAQRFIREAAMLGIPISVPMIMDGLRNIYNGNQLAQFDRPLTELLREYPDYARQLFPDRPAARGPRYDPIMLRPQKRADRVDPAPPYQPLKNSKENNDSGNMLRSMESPVIRLPDVNLNPFGKKGDYWRDDTVVLSKRYEFQGMGTLGSAINKKRFHTLGVYSRNENLSPAAGEPKSVLSINNFPETHFNSVPQLSVFAVDRLSASKGQWETDDVTPKDVVNFHTNPAYSSTVPFHCTDPQNGNDVVGIDNQSVYIRLKNVTLNDTDVAGIKSFSPVLMMIYVMQTKKDIYGTEPSNTVGLPKNLMSTLISNGFKRNFDTRGGSQLDQSEDQNTSVTIRDNVFLSQDCKIIASRKCTLIPGQEAHLHVYLSKKQILSYKYQTRAVIADITAPNVYSPVILKKGEMFIVVEQQGTLASGINNAGVLIEPTQLLYWLNSKYTMSLLQYNNNNQAYGFLTEVAATGVDDKDIDRNEVNQAQVG